MALMNKTTLNIFSCRNASQQINRVLQPLIPFGVSIVSSMGAYTAGLAAAQGVGAALRISCVTPVAGPIGGLLGVGFASALAGEASRRAGKLQKEGWHRTFPFLTGKAPLGAGLSMEELLMDGAIGIVAFRMMGGHFRRVMPSDLTKVGAIARESIPAAGMQYAGDEKRKELARFFRRDGCHHCGTKRGPVIGDHMPPNKHVGDILKSESRRLIGRASKVPVVAEFLEALGISTRQPLQRYYPQCRACSQKQAAAVRNDRSHRVFHAVLHSGGSNTAWHHVGTLVGLRHYHSNQGSQLPGNRTYR